MPKPEFTADEQFLINYAKSPAAFKSGSDHVWGYASGATFVAGVGIYYESVYVMAIAFVVLIGFRIREELVNKRWEPTWRNIFLKYEAALETVQDDADSSEDAGSLSES